MATQWQTANSVWLEDEASGRFELVSTRGLGAVPAHVSVARPRELAQCLGAALPLTCQCASVYPEGFSFCPHCGQALQSAANATNSSNATNPAASWYGPYSDHNLPEHAAKGLGQTAYNFNTCAPQQNTRPNANLPAPPSSRCIFASARFGFASARLVALDYRQNVLQYWDPNAQDWQLLAGHGADLSFTTSEYYWLRPLDNEPGSVAVLPTAQGLMQLQINPLDLSYRLRPLLEQSLVSAPGRVFNYLACLYQHQGQLVLYAKNCETDISSDFPCIILGDGVSDPDSIPDPDSAPAPDSKLNPDSASDNAPNPAWLGGWSRPIAFQGKLMWLHPLGQLIWQPGSAPKIVPWPEGWQARTLGSASLAPPMQSRDGRLWLLGQTRQGYVFLELGKESGKELSNEAGSGGPQTEACDGVRLGFANFMFRLGHPLRAEPWESFTVDDENDHQALVWPLLSCYDARQRHGLVLRLMNTTKTVDQLLNSRDSHDCKLEWLGQTQIELERLSLARPWELVCFVHQQTLWLHHPDWPQMRGWRWPEAL